MLVSSEAMLGAAALATPCSRAGAPSAQAALAMAAPWDAPWSSPAGFCTVNTGTTSVPRSSALVTRRQSPARGGSATAGTSCSCRALARAAARALPAASGSSAAVGVGTASRAGGGCASRSAVAPGLPAKGRGRSPQPASSAGSSRSSALIRATEGQGRQQDQHQGHPDGGQGAMYNKTMTGALTARPPTSGARSARRRPACAGDG